MTHNTQKHTLHTKRTKDFIAFPCYLGLTLTCCIQYRHRYRYYHNEDAEDDAEVRYNNTTNVNIKPADYLYRDEETHIDIRNVMNEARQCGDRDNSRQGPNSGSSRIALGQHCCMGRRVEKRQHKTYNY